RRVHAKKSTSPTSASARPQPISMFHQSDVMPRAARLCACSASCSEPQPARASTATGSVMSRARGNSYRLPGPRLVIPRNRPHDRRRRGSHGGPVLAPHAPAPPAWRPRPAPDRARADRPAPPLAAAARTPALGGLARRLAPEPALRRRGRPRLAAPARAPLVLLDRAPPLGGAHPAGAALVHHGPEAAIRARDVARAALALAGLPLVGPFVLQPLRRLGSACGRRRDADRELVRDARRRRVASLPRAQRERAPAMSTN